jgi:hypothetical protein
VANLRTIADPASFSESRRGWLTVGFGLVAPHTISEDLIRLV